MVTLTFQFRKGPLREVAENTDKRKWVASV
jgi:hypothetical protein